MGPACRAEKGAAPICWQTGSVLALRGRRRERAARGLTPFAGKGGLPPIPSSPNEGEWVDLAAVLEDFKVHVRAGRTARRADECHCVAPRHRATDADGQGLVVPIPRDQA